MTPAEKRCASVRSSVCWSRLPVPSGPIGNTADVAREAQATRGGHAGGVQRHAAARGGLLPDLIEHRERHGAAAHAKTFAGHDVAGEQHDEHRRDERRGQHQQHLLPLAPQEPVVGRPDQKAEHNQDRQIGPGRHAVDAGNRQPKTARRDGAPVARAGWPAAPSWRPAASPRRTGRCARPAARDGRRCRPVNSTEEIGRGPRDPPRPPRTLVFREEQRRGRRRRRSGRRRTRST